MQSVQIVEVAPQDGLQNEAAILAAAVKAELAGSLHDAGKAGHAYLVIDGTLIPIDRVAADRPFYSGKHREHG